MGREDTFKIVGRRIEILNQIVDRVVDLGGGISEVVDDHIEESLVSFERLFEPLVLLGQIFSGGIVFAHAHSFGKGCGGIGEMGF